MNVLLRYIFCVAVFFVAGTSVSLEAATPKLYERLGGKNLGILKNAKFVTILTMVPEGARDQYQTIQEVHLNKEEVERLKRNLLDDHNYDYGRTKQCQFHSEISFKFQDENEKTLHLFVSPSGNQMLFGMGTHSVLLNYDPVQERLENFFQSLVTETYSRNKPKTRI